VCCTIPVDTGTLSAKPNPTILGAQVIELEGGGVAMERVIA
jgi:hypothetical protein